jgi:hypothetical protein
MGRVKWVVLLIIIALIVYFIIPGRDDSSEIEAVISRVAASGREKNLNAVMENFSLGYKDEYGFSYPMVKGLIENYFEKYDVLDVEVSDIDTSFRAEEGGEKVAEAHVSVYVQGMKAGIPVALLGTSDAPERITVTLVKSSVSGWKIKSVGGINPPDAY